MVLKIIQTEHDDLKEFYKKTMNELNSFFEISWEKNKPRIFSVNDRRTINILLGRETEDWLVGWANGKDVYILDKENYESESSHKYSKEEYEALIKHELIHCFTKRISDGSKIPKWLNEGIAIYLSGQTELRKKPDDFKFFIDFFDKSEKEIYTEAGFIVKFLIETYGKEKNLKLIRNSTNVSKNDFAKIFKEIYEFELEYDNFNI